VSLEVRDEKGSLIARVAEGKASLQSDDYELRDPGDGRKGRIEIAHKRTGHVVYRARRFKDGFIDDIEFDSWFEGCHFIASKDFWWLPNNAVCRGHARLQNAYCGFRVWCEDGVPNRSAPFLENWNDVTALALVSDRQFGPGGKVCLEQDTLYLRCDFVACVLVPSQGGFHLDPSCSFDHVVIEPAPSIGDALLSGFARIPGIWCVGDERARDRIQQAKSAVGNWDSTFGWFIGGELAILGSVIAGMVGLLLTTLDGQKEIGVGILSLLMCGLACLLAGLGLLTWGRARLAIGLIAGPGKVDFVRCWRAWEWLLTACSACVLTATLIGACGVIGSGVVVALSQSLRLANLQLVLLIICGLLVVFGLLVAGLIVSVVAAELLGIKSVLIGKASAGEGYRL